TVNDRRAVAAPKEQPRVRGEPVKSPEIVRGCPGAHMRLTVMPFGAEASAAGPRKATPLFTVTSVRVTDTPPLPRTPGTTAETRTGACGVVASGTPTVLFQEYTGHVPFGAVVTPGLAEPPLPGVAGEKDPVPGSTSTRTSAGSDCACVRMYPMSTLPPL